MGPCGAKLSENVKSWLAKGFAVAYGLISFGVVFLVKYLPGVLQVQLGSGLIYRDTRSISKFRLALVCLSENIRLISSRSLTYQPRSKNAYAHT